VKRGTPDHPKTLELARLLGLRKYQAAGVLECLWQFTAEFAKRGDVGRYSNEQLARAIDWDRDPLELVNALVAARWLDESRKHRLLVHDWPDNCEDNVHVWLARAKTRFANGAIPRLTKLSHSERNEIEAHFCAHKARTTAAGRALAGPKPKPSQENGRDGGREPVENSATTPADGPAHPSRSNGRLQVTDATAAEVDTLAAELAGICPDVSADEWIARASRIEPDARRPAKSFRRPREPGVSEPWARTTVRKLTEFLEQARRPLPL
jgi:hypothetical protein